MKLIYITNTRLPSEKANSYQSMQMCSSFAKYFDKVELWTGKGNNTDELTAIKDIFQYYNVKKSFVVRRFFQFDSKFLAHINEFFWANFKGFIFAVNVCINLIKFRNSKEVIFYTRIWHVLYVISIFKKLGLIQNQIYYESHKFSSFLLKILSSVDGLIVINNYLKNLYFENSFESVLLAHDGVNIAEYREISNYEFQPNKKKFNVVYTGSLALWKGVYTLFDSLEYLPTNVELIFVGGSDKYLDDFIKYVEARGGKSRVSIIPHIPKNELLQYTEIAEVLVLPNSAKDKMSLYTSPIKMFEYMASKRPIVASNLPSIKEVLSNWSNSILFEPDNPIDLANKILNVLRTDCSDLVDRAAKDVLPYTWDMRAESITRYIIEKNKVA